MAAGRVGSSVGTKNWRPDARCHLKLALSHGQVNSSNRPIAFGDGFRCEQRVYFGAFSSPTPQGKFGTPTAVVRGWQSPSWASHPLNDYRRWPRWARNCAPPTSGARLASVSRNNLG